MEGLQQLHASLRLRKTLAATGIGYAGVDGAWWQLAQSSVQLPAQFDQQLHSFGHALFLLLDAVADLYGTQLGEQMGLNQLLRHKVPTHLANIAYTGEVKTLRPDFQISDDGWTTSPEEVGQLVATELEIAPSAHGFAHAMQLAYGLPTTLVDNFCQLLNGRPLVIVATQQWSEFIFEQLAFCRALHERGQIARLLYDIPIQQLDAKVRNGECWQLPLYGMTHKPANWQTGLLDRLQASGLIDYLWPDDEVWPEELGDAIFFRFGYLESFSKAQIRTLVNWQECGATPLTPTSFIFEHKAIMAALGLPALRNYIAARSHRALDVLDATIPETLLLTDESAPQLLAERAQWVLKFAGFDHGNQSWGGRSLQVGNQHDAASWQAVINDYLALPFPVVAQRYVPSRKMDVAYYDQADQPQTMRAANTRLRTFFTCVDATPTVHSGSHLTFSPDPLVVAESTESVQAPVLFA